MHIISAGVCVVLAALFGIVEGAVAGDDLPVYEDVPFCGCQSMSIRTVGQSTLNDPRRRGNPPPPFAQPTPLGADPLFTSFNFEITATLVSGSDPNLCTEGQEVRRTVQRGGNTSYKRACSAGRVLAKCANNADCNSSHCRGGTHNGNNCYTPREINNCRQGGGFCQTFNDGVCTDYPYSVVPLVSPPRGNDDYMSPEDIGVKSHLPGKIVWLDAPGSPLGHDSAPSFVYYADFIAYVKGDKGFCQCHFDFQIDWLGFPLMVYLTPPTGLALANDAETQNCQLNP